MLFRLFTGEMLSISLHIWIFVLYVNNVVEPGLCRRVVFLDLLNLTMLGGSTAMHRHPSLGKAVRVTCMWLIYDQRSTYIYLAMQQIFNRLLTVMNPPPADV